ncbi:hypothetical protein [Tannockella kyphosi]|uniref:hypothetical protein n=1 Tax=Tannockella kyphosi TaxID=2899121 RepID=UPI0020138A37|nr:hypothetical protein [Tannockella kyphosi]
MIIKQKKQKNHNLEIGIILALIGTQISRIFIEFFNLQNIELTNIIFALSLVLVINLKNLVTLKLPKFSGYLFLIFGYNIYSLVAAIMAGEGLFTQNQGIIYTLYVIFFLICLSTNHRKIDGNYLVNTMWLISGVLTMMLLYKLTDSFSNFNTNVVYMANNSDRLTLSVIAFYNLCSFLLLKTHKKIVVFMKYLFLICSILVMMIVSRRGLMVTYVVILLYHVFINAQFNLKIEKKTFVSIFKILGTCVVMLATTDFILPDFWVMVEKYFEILIKGVSTYFGFFDSGIDAAAINRYNNITTVPSEYLNSDFLTIIFGNGYGFKQLDIPYLQAFTDLGLIGGVFYLVVQLFYPIKILMIKTNDYSIKFLQYIAILTLCYNLYSGIPYNHYKFIGIILLAYAVTEKRNKNDKCRRVTYENNKN